MEVYKDWKYNKIRMEMKIKNQISNKFQKYICIGFQEKGNSHHKYIIKYVCSTI